MQMYLLTFQSDTKDTDDSFLQERASFEPFVFKP